MNEYYPYYCNMLCTFALCCIVLTCRDEVYDGNELQHGVS